MREAHLDWAARWRVPAGFGVAAVYFLLGRPTPEGLIAGAAVAGLGIGLRAWAAGYLRKGERLIESGPYAYVRHPLYFGSALILLGFALASGRWWLGVALGVAFLAFYVPVLLRDEAEMRARFPADYAAYAAAVPRLVPRFRRRPAGESKERFSGKLYWRNREYNALVGYLLALALLAWRMRPGS